MTQFFLECGHHFRSNSNQIWRVRDSVNVAIVNTLTF